ncbi:MAG: HAD family phosphatase [Candidatus Marinimicrobia bacterium]|nr:HAD family phosphatase [Candidatus Neomarinimicrobiota bacterium]
MNAQHIKKLNIQPEAVIFDFDGVVVNSEPYYEKALHQALAEHGIQITEDDWQDFKGLADAEFWQVFREKYNFKGDLEVIRKENTKLLRENLKELDYISGFKDFYDFIINNYKTGLVTSTSGHHLEWLFNNTPIEDLFEFKVTACDIDNTKPHPAPYRKIAKMLEIEPTKAVVIEDSVNGIKSANAAGMQTIGLLTSFTPEELQIADYLAQDYNDLNAIFGRK